MKTVVAFISLFLVSILLSGCCGLVELAQKATTVKPSETIVTEEREVSGVTEINMSSLGKMIITQGDSESLTIRGSDNVVPKVKTSVRDGVLLIEMDENVNLVNVHEDNVLTFTIAVKDLTALTVAGLGQVEMDSLSTSDLALEMSGAGQIEIGKLKADSINIDMSGLGNVDVSGKAADMTITIAGAGAVNAADLECGTAKVEIPGLGSATVWVTESLTGNISGGGSIRYYGQPQVQIESSGMGSSEALGAK